MLTGCNAIDVYIIRPVVSACMPRPDISKKNPPRAGCATVQRFYRVAKKVSHYQVQKIMLNRIKVCQ